MTLAIKPRRGLTKVAAVLALTSLAACGGSFSGGGFSKGDGSAFSRGGGKSGAPAAARKGQRGGQKKNDGTATNRSTIWDLFASQDNPNTTVEVNKYIWDAALDVLNFLPIQASDPFSGVIVTGYGTPPGGGRAYRATIYVQDPALDARSLNIALATRSGPASPETVRAVEDAILTRARQLRIRDSKL